MECEPVLDDQGYGCTCDSETVIFCFDKRTGEYEWSCSGSCFKQVPKESVATQTETTVHYPPLQCATGTLTQYKATESNDGTKHNSLIPNASDVCEDEMESPVVSYNMTSSEADRVVPPCDELPGQSLSDIVDEMLDTDKDANDNNDNGDEGDRHSDDDDDNAAGGGDAIDDDGDDDNYDVGSDDDDDEDYVANDDDISSDDDDEEEDIEVVDVDDGPVSHVGATADECSTSINILNNDDKNGDEDATNPTDATNNVPNPSQKAKKPRKRKQKQKVSVPKEAFPCPHCSRISKSKGAHEKHVEWHTRSKETKCHLCSREFSQPGNLINHLKKHQQAKEQRENASVGTENPGGKKLGVAECRHCGKLVKRRSIAGHEKAHETRGTRPPSIPKTLECPYCGKISASSSEFKRHERTHTKERPYKCNQCEKAFYSTQDLNLHIRRHLGDKRYKCDHCGKAFIRKCNLDEHFRTHTGARPFKCNYCDKSFGFKNVLKVHLVRHTGIRPHVCEYCNKGFAKKAFLDKHLLSAHQ